MTLEAAFGCGLIGFGPVGVLFIVAVARDPLNIIVFTLSAFFWLLGLLASSVLWYAVVPLRQQLAFGLVFSVLLQEVSRFLFYLLLSKSEAGLKKLAEAEVSEANEAVATAAANGNDSASVTELAPRLTIEHHAPIFDLRAMSLSSGLGFALMGCIIEYIYVYYDVIGPATLMHGPNPGFFFMFAALDSCCMALLQVAWSVILFRAYRLRRFVDIGGVLCLHLLISCLTLLNERATPAQELVCAAFALSVLFSYAWAFFAAGGRLASLSPGGDRLSTRRSPFPTTTTTTTTTASTTLNNDNDMATTVNA